MMKKVAIYIRVSTQEQASGGYSISEQNERLVKYCEAHGWTVSKVYTDPGYSGANVKRPALQSLFRDISLGLFDTVLVYKLDRLSRSQKDTMHIIEDVFLSNNIDFISMNENFDTSTPFGRAMIGILSVFAQLERDQIKERMTMGRIGRAKSGKWSGSSRAPVGYDYQNGELIPNEYEAMQVRMVFDMFLNGLDGKPMSMHAIREYMCKHYSTRYSSWNNESAVGRMLRDPIYAGKITFAGEVYQGSHVPLIAPDVFDAVQNKYATYMETFALSGNRSGYFEHQNLLSGIMFCGLCGARFYSDSALHTKKSGEKIRYLYYRCYSKGGKKSMRKTDKCENRNYTRHELDDLVTSAICSLSADTNGVYRIIQKSAPNHENRGDTIKGRISEIDAQISRLIDLYQLGNVNILQLQSRIDALTAEKSKLESDLEPLKVPRPQLPPEEAIRILKNAISVFENGTMEDKQNLIRSLIHKIVVFPDHIDIHWLFCA